jgi:hypothetical protein
VFRTSRFAALLLPLLLVLGFAPTPAQAGSNMTINPTHATFHGWVNASRTGGATYDTYPGDNYRLTGDCIATIGGVLAGGGVYCEVTWSLTNTHYNVCTTSAAAGVVGVASYWMPGMPAAVWTDLIAVGAPGAATFEGFVPLNTGVLQLKIDAAAACAALMALKADPYANTIPNGFGGTAEYAFI